MIDLLCLKKRTPKTAGWSRKLVSRKPGAAHTDVANKVFELLIACCCMTFAGEIELDHPENSKGSNPDLIVDYDHGKSGIACKALLSQNSKALFDNVEKAVEQIEASPADKGFVIVSLKNVANHDAFWAIADPSPEEDNAQGPQFYAFASPEYAMQRIMEEIQGTSQRYLEHANADLWRDLFKGKKAYPCIVFVLQTACSVRMYQQSELVFAAVDVPVPTTLGVMQIRPIIEIDQHQIGFLEQLNLALHNQL